MAFILLNNQGSIAKNNLNSLALAKDFIRGLLANFATKPQSSNITETADTFNSVYLNLLRLNDGLMWILGDNY